jgi:arylsulfatase A-like enzyme
LQKEDVTIAELLKAQGYMTGQFGKNHLGDQDGHLPTAHGFDEFFGSLYHLNAEDEPENPDYFKDPGLRKRFGTRGVIQTTANGDGTQKIVSTGPLTRKRMETIDEEVTAKALDFMERAKKADKPFFLWWNSTRMHIWTRLKQASEGKTGLGIYPDGTVEHDGHVGQVLDKLKELGLEGNTIVMYSTDNGAEKFTWPDGGQSPFRGEKNTNWEGGYRVPAAIRWPGVIKPGRCSTTFSPMKTCCPRSSRRRGRWRVERIFLLVPAQQYVGQFLGTFEEFPPRQKVGSFSLDQVLESLTRGAGDR